MPGRRHLRSDSVQADSVSFRPEERKQFGEFRTCRPPAVFTNFERLNVTDGLRFVEAERGDQFGAEMDREFGVPLGPAVVSKPSLAPEGLLAGGTVLTNDSLPLAPPS